MGSTIGRSHTHVTRVERAQAPLSLDEARLWLNATDASEVDRATVLALVEAAAAESTPWRLEAGAEHQAEAQARVAAAVVVESFVWQIVPGLLQTAAYCRQAAKNFGVTDLDEYVAARVERQHVLKESGRIFRFVIRDEVLRAVDAEQWEHIVRLDRELDAVTVRVIEFDQLPQRATCSFDLHSDDTRPMRVGIELPHGGLELRRTEDLTVYRALYASLFELARPISALPSDRRGNWPLR